MNKEDFWDQIQEHLRPFVVFYLESYSDDIDRQMQASLSKIVEMRCEYTKKCENARRTLHSMTVEDSTRTQPIFNYVYHKLQKLQEKIDSVKDKIHQCTNEEINHFLDLISKAINIKLPISIDIDAYMEERNKILFQDRELLSLSKKIACLEHYQLSFHRHGKFLRFDSDVLKQALEYGTSNTTSHDPIVDELLGDYLRDTETGRRLVSRATAEITESLNCLDIIPYVKELGMHLHLDHNDQFNLLESAVIRAIFHRIYTQTPELFTHQPELPKFMESCERYILETPRDMKLNMAILDENMLDAPFAELVRSKPKLIEASEVLQGIEFLIDPADILNTVQRAMLCIEAAAKDGIQTETTVIILAWDDWFGLFSHVLAYRPPSNAVAVVKLLKRMKGIEMDHTAEYNYNMLISSVDFLLQSR